MQRLEKRQRIHAMLTLIGMLCVVMLIVCPCYAQLPSTVDEGSIAATYNNVAGQTGWGALGAVPFEQGNLKGHASAVVQGSATLLRSKYHAEIGTSLNNWDFNVYTNGLIKKYTGADAGRVSGVGLAIEAPERKIGVFDVTAGLGIEGQNGGQIGKPNAGDTLEALGYDSEVLEAKGLYNLNPAPTGLSIVQGNAFRALLYAELAHPSGLSIVIKGLPELFGDNETPVHQVVISGNTSVEVSDQISVEIGADLGLQTYNDTLEREFATLVAAKLSF